MKCISTLAVVFVMTLVGISQPCTDSTPFSGQRDLQCNSSGQATIDLTTVNCISEVSFNWLVNDQQALCSFADGPDSDDIIGDALCTSVDHLPNIIVVIADDALITVSVEIISPELLRFVQPALDNKRVQKIRWYINGIDQGKVPIGNSWATAYHLAISFTQAGRYEISFSVDPDDIEPTGVMAVVDWANLQISGNCNSEEDIENPFILCPSDTLVMCPDDIPPIDITSVITSDNCDDLVEVKHLYDISNGQTCPLIITRYYQAIDDSGNKASCIQTITVWDTIPPEIICPPDLDLGCDANTDPDHTGWPTATDNCVGDILFYYRDSLVDNGGGRYTLYREWQAQDDPDKDCCNYSYCTQTISYQVDGFYQETILQKNSSGQKSLEDACMRTTFHWIFPYVYQYPTGDAIGIVNEYPARITIDGTEDLQDGKVTIELWSLDTVASITGPSPPNNRADSISYLLNGQLHAKISVPVGYINRIRLSWDVAVGDEIIFVIDQNDIINNNGPLSITYFTHLTQSGSCGGCETELIITCPDDLTLSCNESTEPQIVDYPTVSPTTAIITYTDRREVGDCPVKTLITRTWQAVYESDTVTCQQQIRVVDYQPPTIQCPADMTIACGTDIPEPDINQIIVYDACDAEIIWLGDTTTTTGLIRTYQVSDGCYETTCTQEFTWENIPIVIECPADLTLNSDQEIPNPDTDLVTVSGQSVTITYDGQSTILEGCTTILQRTYQAFTACDTISCIQTITIVESGTLAITEWPNDITLGCDELYPEWEIVFEECGDPIQVTIYELAESSSTDCEQVRALSAFLTDNQGDRSDTVTWYVTFVDTIPPTLSNVPPDITVDSLDSNTLEDYQITATDNCSDLLTVLVDATVVNDSTILRTFRAVDNCENTVIDSQYIHIITVPDSTDTEDPDGLALCEFYAYPNPTIDGLFTVRFGPSTILGEIGILEIWSIHGMRLTTIEIDPRELTNTPVNINGLQSGIFICKIIVPGIGQRVCRITKTN